MSKIRQSKEEKSELQKCEEHFNSRMEDIRILNELESLESEKGNYENIIDKIKSEFGEKSEYGLSFDYVEEGTFADQREPFIRFQLSWGGPQEEFRFYADESCEFWYLDWGTGEHKNLTEKEKDEVLSFLGGCDWNNLKGLLGIKTE